MQKAVAYIALFIYNLCIHTFGGARIWMSYTLIGVYIVMLYTVLDMHILTPYELSVSVLMGKEGVRSQEIQLHRNYNEFLTEGMHKISQSEELLHCQ